MIVDFKMGMMRCYALFSHILLTTGLYWTKFDSLQVSMVDYTSDHEFIIANQQYVGLISFAIVSLFVEVCFLMASHENVNLGFVMHLFLDVCACFFLSWIILDGQEWQTYGYIFFFCVIVPVSYDLIEGLRVLVQKRHLHWKRPVNYVKEFYYFCVRCCNRNTANQPRDA